MRPSLPTHRWTVLSFFTALLALVPMAAASIPQSTTAHAPKPRVHAVLISGGGQPQSNAQSHLHHLEDMVEMLQARGIRTDNIDVFVSDGDDPGLDMMAGSHPKPSSQRSQKSAPKNTDTIQASDWLKGTQIGQWLMQANLRDTPWQATQRYPASFQHLRDHFLNLGKQLEPGDTVWIFVTDHGVGNTDRPNNGSIILWQDSLTVAEFEGLLLHLKPGVRVVMSMSQCYSGTFAHTMYDMGSALPSGDRCGFFSTQRDRMAYGCYPEGRDGGRFGHAFRMADALWQDDDMASAHNRVVVNDDTPDVPLTTSEVFAANQLQAAAEAQGINPQVWVDSLLRQALTVAGRWEPKLRLLDRIGRQYGTLSPRSLAEIAKQEAALALLVTQVQVYEKRWQTALTSLRRSLLKDFWESQPELATRFKDLKTLAALPPLETRILRETLNTSLTTFAQTRKTLTARFIRLQKRHNKTSALLFRLDTRRGALLRMRNILLQIAAETMLWPEALSDTEPTAPLSAPAQALAALQTCEAWAFPKQASQQGDLPPKVQQSPDPMVALELEQQTLTQILPSWLGVQYQPVTDALRTQARLPAGAVVVQRVFPESPAAAAKLVPGDIVLGPPGQPFEDPNGIREWTMFAPQNTPLTLLVRPHDAPKMVPSEASPPSKPASTALWAKRLKIVLAPFPLELPNMSSTPKVGAQIGPLPSLPWVQAQKAEQKLSLSEPLDAGTGDRLLFFWATWCAPCKAAVPKLLAWSKAMGVPVIAISDESQETVQKFLAQRSEPFFTRAVVDPFRQTFLTFAVAGTPTFVWLDGDQKVLAYGVGFDRKSKALPLPKQKPSKTQLP